jgi:hypothetical protein
MQSKASYYGVDLTNFGSTIYFGPNFQEAQDACHRSGLECTIFGYSGKEGQRLGRLVEVFSYSTISQSFRKVS